MYFSQDADASLDNWYDLFVAAANDHIPKCKARSVNDLPWIDNELRLLLKKKDNIRKKLKRKRSSSTEAKFIVLRRSGFLRGKSTFTQLLEVYHYILDMVAGGQEVDVIHLDLSKKFDKVPHDLLLTKLHRNGISCTALRWFASYLSNRQQRAVLEGAFLDWLPVTSGVPQGSMLGPLLFLVFANEMPSYVQHGSCFALIGDDSKFYRPIDSVSNPALLQFDLDSLHSWSSDRRMAFNTTKCKVFRMPKRRSRRKPLNKYLLGEEELSHSPETSDLGVLSLVTAHGIVISSRCVRRRIGYLV